MFDRAHAPAVRTVLRMLSTMRLSPDAWRRTLVKSSGLPRHGGAQEYRRSALTECANGEEERKADALRYGRGDRRCDACSGIDRTSHRVASRRIVRYGQLEKAARGEGDAPPSQKGYGCCFLDAAGAGSAAVCVGLDMSVVFLYLST